MKRRDFMQAAGISAMPIGLASAATTQQAGKGKTGRRALMKVGAQQWPGQRGPDAYSQQWPSRGEGGYSDDKLAVLAALGVNHLCKTLPVQVDDSWKSESMIKLRERTEKFDIHIDQILCPVSDSFRSIVKGTPERDREIDTVCELIRSVSKAGIPLLQYYLNAIVGVPRSGWKTGRGGSKASAFVYAEAKQDPPLTDAGPVSEEQYWERATYFLKRVVPVAAEYKIKMGCHPQDPSMPYGKPFRGVYRALTTPKNLQRYLDIVPSPYHCLHFCQGTVAEMLEKPGEQIYDVIRHFGQQGKIISVHFRNITGTRANFRETFIDEGDVDMLKACRVYKEVGFDGMLMPDHVPQIPTEPKEFQAYQGFAFTFGYIKALIAAVDAEG
jgi:mannonate dehydratase